MANEEDFEKLFDGSILESLEGALNDISLQMQSSSSDLKNDTADDALSVDSDYSSYHDDDYTSYTNDTGFTYGSDEEEDPDTGEQDLFAMMDNLVAELESEMEFLTTDESNETKDPPPSTVASSLHQDKNEGTHSNPEIDTHSHPETSLGEIAGDDHRPTPVGSSQDQSKNKSAKSLLKVLSALAQSDEMREKVQGSSERNLEDSETTQAGVLKSSEQLSNASTPSEDLMVNKLDRENSTRAPYVPTDADFKHFVGVLADYSKRRRRGKARDRGSDSVAKKVEESREPALENPQSQADIPVNELPDSNREENLDSQDQRKKTSRAMASFTMKKRREYMQRKRQNGNTRVVASARKTSIAGTAVQTQGVGPNVGEKESMESNSSENAQRATPAAKRKKKKKRRRTNKHRKRRPKRHTGTALPNYQATTEVPGASPGAVTATTQDHATDKQHDNRAKEEVIQALAKTELWRWLVTQVQDGKQE